MSSISARWPVMAGRELQELWELVSVTVHMRTLFWTFVFIRTILKSAAGRGQMRYHYFEFGVP